MNKYKSISAGQLHQNVWKNPLTDIPKDTEREQNYRKIFNPQRSYDTVYRQLSFSVKLLIRDVLMTQFTENLFHKSPTPLPSSSI